MDNAIRDFIKNNKPSNIWEFFANKPTKNVRKLKVLILNAPCMGFGDIVFAMKFATLLREWYNCEVMIATPQKKGFVSLGEKPSNIYDLNGKNKSDQCRRLSRLTINKDGKEIPLPKADLLFVAPLQADFDPKISDVQKLLPYANKFNTFYLSEYNDVLTKKIDFNTGIGGKRLGLLFTDMPPGPKPQQLKHPYCVVYVANVLPRMKSCVYNFLTMVTKKYKNQDFEIVIPSWIDDEEFNMKKDISKILQKYFRHVVFVKKDKTTTVEGKGDHTIYIRMDILPLSNKLMVDLMTHSVKDILLTGDQSITDALSCCVDKNIFYQIAPWKENFAKNLVKEMPNKWLQRKSESCGTLKAIHYKSDYVKFKKQWDFRKLAKPKMDGIFNFTAEKIYGPNAQFLQHFQELALKSNKKGLKNL